MSKKRTTNFDRAATPLDNRESQDFLLNQIAKYESQTCWSHQDRLDLLLLIKSVKPNEALSYIAGALESRNPKGMVYNSAKASRILDNPGRNARPAEISACLTEAIASIKHDLMTKSIQDFLGKVYTWGEDQLSPIEKHDNRQQFDRELLVLSKSCITPEQQYEFRRTVRAYMNACYAFDQDSDNYPDSKAYENYPHLDIYERPESPISQFYGWIDTNRSMADIRYYAGKTCKSTNSISYTPQ